MERATLERLPEQRAAAQRLRLILRGAVQGVGFRPFVYRLATELGLSGWVNNNAQGVVIEVEGAHPQLESFLVRLEREQPPRASIQNLEPSFLDPVGYASFAIHPSDATGEKLAVALPDIATCPECVRDIRDPANRRYRYPFTNCTNCGPRFSLIQALPYDRANTTMRRFTMCGACQAEYDDPRDRRFHAQPNACPRCGPHLELWDAHGDAQASHHEALHRAARAILDGAIVAVKGLGGFHLMVDARNSEAVRRLRRRKHREEKPLALMAPSLETVARLCEVSDLEARLLQSPAAPIVLLRRRAKPDDGAARVAAEIAPGHPSLGVMVPYTPLHHLLLGELGVPVVATSGNLSDEPICTDEYQALKRLAGIADLFLIHDRPIARHMDDSIVRVVLRRELVLRRARGYAPLSLPLQQTAETVLAVGGHLKNTVALSVGRHAVLSQHIGDLDTAESLHAFHEVIESVSRLYDARPTRLACDAHPDYRSTQEAGRFGVPVIRVQHHEAHVRSCMADNDLTGPVLGVAWDGAGYGLDGTIWGGEFFVVTEESCKRVASFRPFRLPGGDRAIQEPRRTAIGLLFALFGEELVAMRELAPIRACAPQELATLRAMLRTSFNAPLTSSVGRLFDAVASLTGLRQRMRYEGQAAMELEDALEGAQTEASYAFEVDTSGSIIRIDWAPMIRAIVEEVRQHASAGEISARFHNTLAEMIVEMAQRLGQARVALSGGCFQNRYLTERTVARLRAERFRPYWHQRVPPNDGGIALGQLAAVRELSATGAPTCA